jgi:hypothetical protein
LTNGRSALLVEQVRFQRQVLLHEVIHSRRNLAALDGNFALPFWYKHAVG